VNYGRSRNRTNGAIRLNHHSQKASGLARDSYRSRAWYLNARRDNGRLLAGNMSSDLNMVSLMNSRFRVGQPQGRLNVQEVKEAGESECSSVIEKIGLYPRRKAADFQLVSNGNAK